jgi:hypothetical protein
VVLRSFELLTLASVNPTLAQSRRHPRPPRRVALDPHTFQKIRLANKGPPPLANMTNPANQIRASRNKRVETCDCPQDGP